MSKSETLIKLLLAILMFLCLLDMAYGFYQFVRFAGLIGFSILSYQASQHGRQAEMILYGCLSYPIDITISNINVVSFNF
ncbi:DUF6804 family protein [Gelidibacter japonicus]|uniref:DUF6804 family protein n=1 Tax=Gelidibacter japonicus TaxID=1962232 RepID=UPI0027E49924|nr:DUF6804 family protein [Gelidibacter japonicus]